MSDHGVLGTLFADALASADASARWDFGCGHVDDRMLVASTSHKGHGETNIRHWLIDVETLDVRGPVLYSVEVTSNPLGLGDGTWLTMGPSGREASEWRCPA
jgi:hypothetical protein